MHKLVKLSIASCIAVAAIGSATAATLQLKVDNTKAAANTYSVMKINGVCTTSLKSITGEKGYTVGGTIDNGIPQKTLALQLLCQGKKTCPIELLENTFTGGAPTNPNCDNATDMGSASLDLSTSPTTVIAGTGDQFSLSQKTDPDDQNNQIVTITPNS